MCPPVSAAPQSHFNHFPHAAGVWLHKCKPPNDSEGEDGVSQDSRAALYQESYSSLDAVRVARISGVELQFFYSNYLVKIMFTKNNKIMYLLKD